MSNINLLPEDKRGKEKKELEKVAKAPKNSSLEMTAGDFTSPSSDSDKRGEGIWDKLYGKKNVKSIDKISSTENKSQLEKSVIAEKKQSVNFKTPKKNKTSVFGRFRSPINKVNEPKVWYNKSEDKKSNHFLEQQPKKNDINFMEGKTEKKNQNKNTDKGLGFNIDLMPEELLVMGKVDRNLQFFVILIGLLITTGILVGMHFVLSSYDDMLKTRTNDSKQKLTELKIQVDKQLKLQEERNKYDKKILALKEINENHIYWTQFFSGLEKYILDDIVLGNFNAGVSGSIILPATAGSYDTAVAQIAALRNAPELVKEVRVDSFQTNYDAKRGFLGVNFDIKLLLADKIFIKK